MTRLDYNFYHNWTLPADENGADDGFLLEYLDGGESNHPDHEGYITWSPKSVFENSYQDATKGVSFGNAVELAKLGYKIARTGWNGSGMFAYIVSEGSYPAKSPAVMGVFANDMVPYREYWALKTTRNDVAPWAPSGSDSLANDWVAV